MKEQRNAPVEPPALSLRDWFAGQALSNSSLADFSTGGLDGVVTICWRVADMMVREARKTQ
jgi:hypothetical protein